MNAAGPVITLNLGDLVLPALWLRDSCGCAECRFPATGQRLVGSARVARLFGDTAVARHLVRDGRLSVVFAPDGHESEYELAWLERHAPGRGAREGDQSARARVPWTATDLPTGPPRVAWDCLIFDNTRVLHGRTAYGSDAEGRHLQGCYIDMDGLRGTLEALRRDGTRIVAAPAGPPAPVAAARVVATRASARPIAVAGRARVR